MHMCITCVSVLFLGNCVLGLHGPRLRIKNNVVSNCWFNV